jgi:hypothetical protein
VDEMGSGISGGMFPLGGRVVGLQIYHINKPTDEPIDVASEGITENASLTELEEGVGFDMPEFETLPFEKAETTYTNAFGIARIDYYGS